MMKMCLNPKVLGGPAAVAVGLFAFAPDIALAALPVLFALACPLSMLGMALFMRKGMRTARPTGGTVSYTCPMHPQGRSATPGPCPACGMALAPVPALPSWTAPAREERRRQIEAQLRETRDRQEALTRELGALEEAPLPGQNGRGEEARQAAPGA